jgi:predicted phosphodiesterase
MWTGMRLVSPGEYRSALGDVSLRVGPSWHGEVEAFVPLADWGVRARAFSAPVRLHGEPRTVNRQAVLRAAGGQRGVLKETEASLKDAAGRALLRAGRFALGGALGAALLAVLLLRALGVRERRWLIAAPAGMLIVALVLTVATVLRVRGTFDPEAFEHPRFYARGAELSQLIKAAANAKRAGNSYEAKVSGALTGVARLLSVPDFGRVARSDRGALLASDLHNNRFVLKSLAPYATGQPVFFVGDFGMTGSGAEARLLARPIARLGSRVVAVSGNHDSARFMRRLRAAGVTVLTRRSAPIDVGGLRVAGFDDPLEWTGRNPNDPKRIFSFGERGDGDEERAAAGAALVRWFDELPARPDVVLVHQNGLAQSLARTLAARPGAKPLAILTGHDHKPRVTVRGPVTVVDAGTAGASGIYGVGHEPVGLGQLRFAAGRRGLAAVDVIRAEPVSGTARAVRVPIALCREQPKSCDEEALD